MIEVDELEQVLMYFAICLVVDDRNGGRCPRWHRGLGLCERRAAHCGTVSSELPRQNRQQNLISENVAVGPRRASASVDVKIDKLMQSLLITFSLFALGSHCPAIHQDDRSATVKRGCYK